MGERVEERTGGNREFTGEAYTKGATGVAKVSLVWELGSPGNGHRAAHSPNVRPWARACPSLGLSVPTSLCK